MTAARTKAIITGKAGAEESTSKLLAEWFWVDRWTGSSAFMLPLEPRGLYREMLSQAWRRGARLPNDHEAIQRVVGCTLQEWKRCWPRIEKYWRVDGDSLVNDTQMEVYSEAKARLDRASAAGKRASAVRWSNPSDANSDVRSHVRSHIRQESPPSPSPSPDLSLSPVLSATTSETLSRSEATDPISEKGDDHFQLHAEQHGPVEKPARLVNGKSIPPPDFSPIVLSFPVVGTDGPIWHLREALLDHWQQLYPMLDVAAQSRQMLAWVEQNPSKRKTAKGMPAALVNWLNRAVDRPHGRGPAPISGSLKTAGNKAAIEEFIRRRYGMGE